MQRLISLQKASPHSLRTHRGYSVLRENRGLRPDVASTFPRNMAGVWAINHDWLIGEGSTPAQSLWPPHNPICMLPSWGPIIWLGCSHICCDSTARLQGSPQVDRFLKDLIRCVNHVFDFGHSRCHFFFRISNPCFTSVYRPRRVRVMPSLYHH